MRRRYRVRRPTRGIVPATTPSRSTAATSRAATSSAQGLEPERMYEERHEVCIRPLRHHRPASRSDERIRYRPPSGPLLLQLPRVRQPIGGAEESIRARRRRLLPRLPLLRLRPQPRHPRPGLRRPWRGEWQPQPTRQLHLPHLHRRQQVHARERFGRRRSHMHGFQATVTPLKRPVTVFAATVGCVNRMILDYDTAVGAAAS